MAWYKTGTVAVAATKVTGTGTNFLDAKFGIGPGQAFLIPGSGTVKIYEIASVEDATHLTLTTTAGTVAAGTAYAVMSFYTDSVPDFSKRLAAQLGYYQSQMDGWQTIMTGTGAVSVTAPDGTVVNISSFAKLTSDIAKAYVNGGNLGTTIFPNNLGNTADFNIYYQTANANAVIANGYPIAKAGTLFVTPSAYGCQQMYITFQGEAFVRGLTGTFNPASPNWSDWWPIFTGKSTIPIANGGTGAPTVAAARSALGITPGNIGAVPTAGGSMTGALSIGVKNWALTSNANGNVSSSGNQVNSIARGDLNGTQYGTWDIYGTSSNILNRLITWNTSYKVFGFYDNGNGTCDGQWVGGSDERFKGNITDFTQGLVATLSCRHVTYDKQDGAREIGVIAQDVERFADCAVINVGKKEFGNGRVIEDFKGLNTAGFAAAAHGNAITSLFELLDLALNDPDAARSKIAEYKAAIVPPVPLTAEQKIFGGKTIDEMPADTDFTDTDLPEDKDVDELSS